MPLTKIQTKLGRLLAKNRSEDSYLAGGAAILSSPKTERYSQDLDYFHDSPERVATAFATDRKTLEENGWTVETELILPGHVRATVGHDKETTRVEWAHDSAWRFMPVMKSDDFGYQLDPIDLATNKILALAGRDEPRDLLDALHLHRNLLGLGPLVWAATGKDPGFSPRSLLEMLRRRGKIRPEDLLRLNLSIPHDIHKIKGEWLEALQDTEAFVLNRPPEEAGCLYFDPSLNRFVDPRQSVGSAVVKHFGRPGGIIPRFLP
jgi:hypothetical protein